STGHDLGLGIVDGDTERAVFKVFESDEITGFGLAKGLLNF
ncbi:MAG: hypothetical protein ACJAT3_002072, partial [Akkermansiaceae bacterium]